MFALIFGLVIIALCSLAIGGARKKQGESIRSFFWADGNMKAYEGIHLFLSTSFSLNGVLYFMWLGYSIGIAASIIQLLWCISFILLARYTKRIEKLSEHGTMHGVIGSAYGLSAEKWAAIASLIGFVLQIGWELIIGATIFMTALPQSSWVQGALIVVLAVVAGLYTMFGGLRGNARANELQNYLSIIVLFGLLGWLFFHAPSGSAMAWDSGSWGRLVTSLGVGGLITNAVFSLVWQFVDMSAWQNVVATTKGGEGATKKTLYGSAVAVFIFPGLIATMLGMYLRGMSDLTSDNILTTLLQMFSTHPIALLVVGAGLAAAMLSTVDGFLLSSAQAVVWDLTHRGIVQKILGGSEAEQGFILKRTRFWIGVLALIGGGLIYAVTVLFKVSIFDLVYMVTIAQVILFPVVLAALYGKGSSRKLGAWSIALGLFVGAALVIYGVPRGMTTLLTWTPIIALIAATLPVLIDVMTRKKEKALS
jgi:hypothetical protein